jgi:hypothetical protein
MCLCCKCSGFIFSIEFLPLIAGQFGVWYSNLQLIQILYATDVITVVQQLNTVTAIAMYLIVKIKEGRYNW